MFLPEWHVIQLSRGIAREGFDPYGMCLGGTGTLEVTLIDRDGFSTNHAPRARLSALVLNEEGEWDFQFTFVVGTD